EIDLIARIAAEPARQKQQYRVEQPLRRPKSGEQHHRLAFEHGPDKHNQIEPGAVFSDQLIDIHLRPFSSVVVPRPPMMSTADTAFLSATMLGSSEIQVERICLRQC